jgi:hypothetical protein
MNVCNKQLRKIQQQESNQVFVVHHMEKEWRHELLGLKYPETDRVNGF